jgi:hypothetical protein
LPGAFVKRIFKSPAGGFFRKVYQTRLPIGFVKEFFIACRRLF